MRRTIKVVIIDDSALIRERLSAMLSELPGVVVSAQCKDGLEGIEAIKRFCADVVVLDIKMPGISGVEVLRQAKALSSVPVVIVLTNYSHDQFWKACMEAGADAFFDKSNEFDKVSSVISSLQGRT